MNRKQIKNEEKIEWKFHWKLNWNFFREESVIKKKLSWNSWLKSESKNCIKIEIKWVEIELKKEAKVIRNYN